MTESLKEQRVHPVRPWSSCCYKMQVGMSRRHLDQKDQPKHMETVRMDPFMDGCVGRCCLLVHVLSTEYGVHTPAQCKSQDRGQLSTQRHVVVVQWYIVLVRTTYAR